MKGKRSIGIGDEVILRIRVSEKDVHYAGGLVNGAWVLGIFGDLATEIGARYDNDEGLLAGYSDIKLTAPVSGGDFIEAVGKLVKVGNTSRIIELEAKKVISNANNPDEPSAVVVFDEPVTVATATMIQVVPRDCQRCG